jgi:hypothetical protein
MQQESNNPAKATTATITRGEVGNVTTSTLNEEGGGNVSSEMASVFPDWLHLHNEECGQSKEFCRSIQWESNNGSDTQRAGKALNILKVQF